MVNSKLLVLKLPTFFFFFFPLNNVLDITEVAKRLVFKKCLCAYLAASAL